MAESEDKGLQQLRRRAELLTGRRPPAERPSTPAEAARLIHELETHQIELELQNEELRAAQTSLELARDRYADLYDRAPVGYATLDHEGVVLQANLRLAELLGTERGRLTARRLAEHVAKEDQDAYFLTLRKQLKTGAPETLELRFVRADSDVVWFRSEWMRVEEADGPPRLRVALTDTSAQKRLQAQLAQADRMASVGLLAAGVAHEINNPLTYVLYNLETLASELPLLAGCLVPGAGPPASSGPREDLPSLAILASDAVEGALRIRDIVKHLRVFSHFDEAATSVAINGVLDQVVTMATSLFKYRAELIKDYGDIPPVSANEGHLIQVFLNLLVNAAQAIDEGDIEGNRIGVRTWLEGDQVVTEVSDTGRGIPADLLDRVFDPFFTTKDVGEGAGLGLSICHRIVAAYGGEILIDSAPGEGCRVTVRLPRQTRSPANQEPLPPWRLGTSRPSGAGS